ncbi:MAG: hypothetical protein ABL882_04780 [Sphingopyxis sp.]
MLARNPWLIAAAWGSVAASVLHIACIIGGPDWYRWLGAGEEMARAAERGAWMPTIVTLGIAAVLAAWAAFAFSAAGVILRLPLTRTALVLICGVLLLRAAAGLFGAFWRPDLSGNFMLISSLIVLALGLCFVIGTWQTWAKLSNRGV